MDPRFVGPMERLLYLRSLPHLETLPPEEIALLAQHARERVYRRGQTVLKEGQPVGSVYLLVEGSVSVRRGGRLLRYVGAPYGAGFLGILDRDPNGFEVVAETDVLALEIAGDLVLDAMEDNFPLLRSTVAQLSKQLIEVQKSLESIGMLGREEPQFGVMPAGPIDLVDRLVALRARGPFQQCSLDSLTQVARQQPELRFDAGAVLWEEGDESAYGLSIVCGIVRCAGKDPPREFRMGAGSAIGHLETFAQLPRSYRAVTETPVAALRDDPEVFFDMLEDNFRAGFDLVTFLARQVTSLYEQASRVEETTGRPSPWTRQATPS